MQLPRAAGPLRPVVAAMSVMFDMRIPNLCIHDAHEIIYDNEFKGKK